MRSTRSKTAGPGPPGIGCLASAEVPFTMLIQSLIESENVTAARVLVQFAISSGVASPDILRLRDVLAIPRVTVGARTDVDRTREYRWLARNAAVYRGLWIAIDGERLLAENATLAGLLPQIKSLRLSQPPLVHRVE